MGWCGEWGCPWLSTFIAQMKRACIISHNLYVFIDLLENAPYFPLFGLKKLVHGGMDFNFD